MDITVFENSEFGKIRTLEANDGKVLFCGIDVATALGYAKPNNAISAHCRYALKQGVPHPQSQSKTIEMSFIPESDVYRLAFGSKLSAAEKFTDWVTEEVLPAIRKHGAYATPQTIEKMIADPDFAIRLFEELKAEQEKRKALENTVAVQSQQISELQPKASYYDMVLNCKDLLSVTQIAKDYGKSAQWLNEKLHDNKIQYKQGGIWLLYQNYAEQGYTSTKTQPYSGSDGMIHSKVHTYWTQKGRLFIYELLKKDGVLPLIERGITNES